MNEEFKGLRREITELYQIILPYACFGVEIENDQVVDIAPIWHTCKGRGLKLLKNRIAQSGGKMIKIIREKRRAQMKKFVLYIKSHCDLPDYEEEVEANSKEEALDHIWKRSKWNWIEAGWEKEDLLKYMEEVE
jgi:hypothetical protein